jgi:hypothetical protein
MSDRLEARDRMPLCMEPKDTLKIQLSLYKIYVLPETKKVFLNICIVWVFRVDSSLGAHHCTKGINHCSTL